MVTLNCSVSTIIHMTSDELTNEELEQLTNDNHLPPRPTIEQTDLLADKLVEEFNNPEWREWYCKKINLNGIELINEYRLKARKGYNPPKLFSALLRQAPDNGTARIHIANTSTPTYSKKIDDVYIPIGNLTQENVDRFVSREIDVFLRQYPDDTDDSIKEDLKAIPWLEDIGKDL